ncbi:hypothetical protein [Mycobacterium uberis]|uniref:hypothetical protein n=1 Tax=Mycobacterium uberis TaxID=2162698 RepID=UPI000E300FE9|nr:hypothetical protein [Mycobacterium uberis]
MCSILVPLIDEGEQFVTNQENLGYTDTRQFLQGYFDFHYWQHEGPVLALAELAGTGLTLALLTRCWRGVTGSAS